jgi:hypothetical protein
MFKMFKLYFEEVPNASPVHWDAIHDFGGIEFNKDGTMKVEDPKFDDKGDLVKDEPKTEEPKDEEKTDEVDEEGDTETPEPDTTETVDESVEENTDESTEEPAEEPEDAVTEKRLKDTQRAYHEGQQKIKELSDRLEKLEKPVEKKPDELTLENIDPQVLAQSMAKDPVMTTRWIVDQQAKLSFKVQTETNLQEVKAQERTERIEKSEEIAVKRFPIIDKILKMKDEDVPGLKASNPEQYEFITKTIEYQKAFEARGDEEALLNAASRAYAELSPKALEKIKADITKAVTQNNSSKKNTVKQAVVGGGSSTKPGKPVNKPSEGAFFKLNPQDQHDAMYADFEKRLANLNKK